MILSLLGKVVSIVARRLDDVELVRGIQTNSNGGEFVLVLRADGRIVAMSDEVEQHLGKTMVRIVGLLFALDRWFDLCLAFVVHAMYEHLSMSRSDRRREVTFDSELSRRRRSSIGLYLSFAQRQTPKSNARRYQSKGSRSSLMPELIDFV